MIMNTEKRTHTQRKKCNFKEIHKLDQITPLHPFLKLNISNGLQIILFSHTMLVPVPRLKKVGNANKIYTMVFDKILCI